MLQVGGWVGVGGGGGGWAVWVLEFRKYELQVGVREVGGGLPQNSSRLSEWGGGCEGQGPQGPSPSAPNTPMEKPTLLCG